MATIKEVLNQEDQGRNCIYLYKEGIFLIAYDRSAYLFTKYIKKYNARRKYYKGIERSVCSIGFPEKVFQGIMESCGRTSERTEGEFRIEIPEAKTDQEEFDLWQKEATEKVEKKKEIPEDTTQKEYGGQENILERIGAFDLANKSPVECMIFLAEIQKEFKTMNKTNNQIPM